MEIKKNSVHTVLHKLLKLLRYSARHIGGVATLSEKQKTPESMHIQPSRK